MGNVTINCGEFPMVMGNVDINSGEINSILIDIKEIINRNE